MGEIETDRGRALRRAADLLGTHPRRAAGGRARSGGAGGRRRCGRSSRCTSAAGRRPRTCWRGSGWRRGARVLDVGCGIGGRVADAGVQHGAVVTGVDLTPEFVAAAEELSRRAGVAGVTFRQASALDLPFDDGELRRGGDAARGHERAGQAAAVRRGGAGAAAGRRLRVYDLMRFGPGPLSYPMPWAQDAATSFVEAPDDYAAAAAAAGFQEMARSERREGRRLPGGAGRAHGRDADGAAVPQPAGGGARRDGGAGGDDPAALTC